MRAAFDMGKEKHRDDPRGRFLMKIAVIDGESGTIGATVITKIRRTLGERIEIWALGTNAIATDRMMKAGANRGAAGEAAITRCAGQVDIIVGSISILIAHAFLGEVTPSIAEAVGTAEARKLILPISQESVTVVSTFPEPLPHMVEGLVKLHLAPLVEAAGKNRKPH